MKKLKINKKFRDSNFKELLNIYLDKLQLLEIISSPSYHLPNKREEDHILLAMEYYDLLIVENSLNELYRYTTEIYDELLKYRNEYNSDWKYYATTKRMESIKEYGGEPEDYIDENEIKFSDKYEDIKTYTIVSELNFYLGEDFRGPSFGTSTSKDYEKTSLFVKNKTEFNPFKFLQNQGKPIGQAIMKDGELIPITNDADRIEHEMNQDIKNNSVVDLFEKAIDKTIHIKNLILKLDDKKNNEEEVNNIILNLENLLNLNF